MLKRRRFLAAGAVLAGAVTAAPRTVFAAPETATARDAALRDIAKRELQRMGDTIWHHDMAAIVDFGLHSSEKRINFIDLQSGTVRSFLVTHGSGSDPEHTGWLQKWSNVPNSLASSRGAYRTRNWYVGRYGQSMRVDGLDPTNNNALKRAIVMHQADYATPQHVEKWGLLGRSDGCFSMGPEQFRYALENLHGGRLLYAESLGIGADGNRVERPEISAAVALQPDNPTPIQRLIPGLY